MIMWMNSPDIDKKFNVYEDEGKGHINSSPPSGA